MSYSCSHDIVDYIAKLNRVSSEPDILSPNTDHFSLDNNLAMFSNTQFFDFDLGHDADLQSVPVKATADLVAPLAATGFSYGKIGTFSTDDDYQDTRHKNIAAQLSNTIPPYSPSSPEICKDSSCNQFQNFNTASPSSIEINEISRHAAEEDKRRRNTAASARFRMKKKQREQALEKSAKEMSDKLAKLENRIRMLETENKWLKDLITAKNDDRVRDG